MIGYHQYFHLPNHSEAVDVKTNMVERQDAASAEADLDPATGGLCQARAPSSSHRALSLSEQRSFLI